MVLHGREVEVPRRLLLPVGGLEDCGLLPAPDGELVVVTTGEMVRWPLLPPVGGREVEVEVPGPPLVPPIGDPDGREVEVPRRLLLPVGGLEDWVLLPAPDGEVDGSELQVPGPLLLPPVGGAARRVPRRAVVGGEPMLIPGLHRVVDGGVPASGWAKVPWKYLFVKYLFI